MERNLNEVMADAPGAAQGLRREVEVLIGEELSCCWEEGLRSEMAEPLAGPWSSRVPARVGIGAD